MIFTYMSNLSISITMLLYVQRQTTEEIIIKISLFNSFPFRKKGTNLN